MKIIAIVGGGPGAVATFIQLVRYSRATDILICDETPIGIGIGFGTFSLSHLCNTSASQNSVDADNPNDFVEYLSSFGWPVSREAFVPRYLVTQYCRNRYLLHLKIARKKGIRAIHIEEKVATVKRNSTNGQLTLTMASHCHHVADAVLICVGARSKSIRDCASLLGWKMDEELSVIGPYPSADLLVYARNKEKIAILGSKLGAIDAAISLCEAGKRVTLISRSGHLPSVRTSLTNKHPNPFLVLKERTLSSSRHFINGIGAILKREGIRFHSIGRDPIATLAYEIEAAECGNNIWQEHIADIIDIANSVLPDADPEITDKIKRRTGHLVSRYVSSMPLFNAKKLFDFHKNGQLILKKMTTPRIIPRGGRFHLESAGSSESYDGLVLAVGTSNPVINGRADDLHIGYGEACDTHAVPTIDELRQARIWLVGSTNSRWFPIVNYLKFSVDNARNVVDDLVRTY